MGNPGRPYPLKCAICSGPLSEETSVLFSREPGGVLEEGCPGCVAEYNYLAPYLNLLREEETSVEPAAFSTPGARPKIEAWKPLEKEGPVRLW